MSPWTSVGTPLYLGWAMVGTAADGGGGVGLDMSDCEGPVPTSFRLTITAGTAFSSMGLTSPLV